MLGILEFQTKVGFSVFKMCRIVSTVTFSVHDVITFNEKGNRIQPHLV